MLARDAVVTIPVVIAPRISFAVRGIRFGSNNVKKTIKIIAATVCIPSPAFFAIFLRYLIIIFKGSPPVLIIP